MEHSMTHSNHTRKLEQPYTQEQALKTLQGFGPWEQLDEGTYAKQGIHSSGVRTLRSAVFPQYDINSKSTGRYESLLNALKAFGYSRSSVHIVPEDSAKGESRQVRVEIVNPRAIEKLGADLLPAGTEIKEPEIPGTAFTKRLAAEAAGACRNGGIV
jgi:hypothetical protein